MNQNYILLAAVVAIAAWNRRASINSVVCEAGGWKLVPVEPTEEMLWKAQERTPKFVHGDPWYGCEEISEGQALECYRAMLSASPPPPGSAGDSAKEFPRSSEADPSQRSAHDAGGSEAAPEERQVSNLRQSEASSASAACVLASAPRAPINGDSAEADKTKAGGVASNDTLERAADFLEQYAAFIHRVKPEEIEEHPYLPELEQVAADVRATAGMSAEGGEAKSETTPEEDAALLWLGTVRDDFRRMADEANRLLSHHAMNIAASPKAGESRMEPDLREAAHTLEVAIRFAQHGLVPTAEEVTDWREVMYRLKAGERKGCHPLREASSDCTYCHGHCPSPEGCERAERLAAGVSAKDCKDCPGRESLMCCKRNAGVPIGWRRAGGGQAVKYTPETIGEAILAHVKANFGTQRAAADAFGCGHTFLNQVVHGERRPSNTMLQAIGFRHVEVWIPAGSSLPGDALPLRKDSHD